MSLRDHKHHACSSPLSASTGSLWRVGSCVIFAHPHWSLISRLGPPLSARAPQCGSRVAGVVRVLAVREGLFCNEFLPVRSEHTFAQYWRPCLGTMRIPCRLPYCKQVSSSPAKSHMCVLARCETRLLQFRMSTTFGHASRS